MMVLGWCLQVECKNCEYHELLLLVVSSYKVQSLCEALSAGFPQSPALVAGWGPFSLREKGNVCASVGENQELFRTLHPHFQEMLIHSSILFVLQSNIQGKIFRYLIENLNGDHWFILERRAMPVHCLSANLVRIGTVEGKINSSTSCVIKYQIVIQLGVLCTDSSFPGITHQI